MNWFNIPELGIKGSRNLEHRTQGLSPLLDHINGKTILDLGSAEGLISHWLMKNGASHACCIERKHQSVEVSHELFKGMSYEMIDADLGNFENIDIKDHDIVLALGIIQKLSRKKEFIQYFSNKAKEFFVIRIPSEYITIKEVQKILPKFKLYSSLTEEDQIKAGERPNGWVAIFKRV